MSLYPVEFTPLKELFHVTDFAKTRLRENIDRESDFIVVESTDKFPPEGIITITADPGRLFSIREEDWAMSYYYKRKTKDTFEDLTLVKGNFAPKYKNERVTLNVISDHHNRIAEEIMHLEKIAGTLDSKDPDSLRFRIERLKKFVRKPRAFFMPTVTRGFYPLSVNFEDKSTRIPDKWLWEFGDGTTSPKKDPVHTYLAPGVYSVRLTVFNDYGTDSFYCMNLIEVLGEPPEAPIAEVLNPRELVGEPITIRATPRDGQTKNQFREWGWILDPNLEPVHSNLIRKRPDLGPDLFLTSAPQIEIKGRVGGRYSIGLVGYGFERSFAYNREDINIEIIEPINFWDFRAEQNSLVPWEYGLMGEIYRRGTPKSGVLPSPEIPNNGYLESNRENHGIVYVMDSHTGTTNFYEYDSHFEVWTQLEISLENSRNNNLASYSQEIYLLNSTSLGRIVENLWAYSLLTRTIKRNISPSPLIDLSGTNRSYTNTSWYGTNPGIYFLSKVDRSYFREFRRYDPNLNISITLTSPSEPPATTLNKTGINVFTPTSQLTTMKDGLYLFGPNRSIGKYDPKTGSWGSDKVKDSGFSQTNPIHAGSNEEIAFIEQGPSRYSMKFDLKQGIVSTIQTQIGRPIGKGVY